MPTSTADFKFRYQVLLDGKACALERFPSTREDAIDVVLKAGGAKVEVAEFTVHWVSPYDDDDSLDCVARLERGPAGTWHLTQVWCDPEAFGAGSVASWRASADDLMWFVCRFSISPDDVRHSHVFEEMMAEGLGPYERLNLTSPSEFVISSFEEQEHVSSLARERVESVARIGANLTATCAPAPSTLR